VVEVLFRHQRVASHARSCRPGDYTTVAEHMPASHRAHREWTPGRLLHWAASIGAATASLVTHLLESRPHPEQGYRACLGLLALARKYGDARLEAGCARALTLGAKSRKSVASILAAGLDRQVPATRFDDAVLPAHANVRGPEYYH
jgi:transposase